MNHKEYIKIAPGADIVILFIHGIIGTPDHFDEFISLVPDSISVYNILLDGHGKTPKDFSATSMKKWREQVDSVIEELSLTHKKIFIVAHSMGTLFAMEQATKRSNIKELFLLAAPLKLFIKPRMFINSGKVYLNHIKDDDAEALASKACYGIGSDKNPFHYVGWLPRYFELFAEIKRTRKTAEGLSVPCTAYQSHKDEMVSRHAANYLEKNNTTSIKWLKNSGHYYYREDDRKYLMNEFGSFVEKIQNLS